jgi:hypothetical protein
MLKHFAANRKRRLSALSNVGPYIYDVKVSCFTRSSIYIYNVSRLRVKERVYTPHLGLRGLLQLYLYLYQISWRSVQLEPGCSLPLPWIEFRFLGGKISRWVTIVTVKAEHQFKCIRLVFAQSLVVSGIIRFSSIAIAAPSISPAVI